MALTTLLDACLGVLVAAPAAPPEPASASAPVAIHDAERCLGPIATEVPSDHAVIVDVTPLEHDEVRLVVIMRGPAHGRDEASLLVRDRALRVSDCPQAARLVDHWLAAALADEAPAAASDEPSPRPLTDLRLATRPAPPIGASLGAGVALDGDGDVEPVVTAGIVLDEALDVTLYGRVASSSEAVAMSLGVAVDVPLVGDLALLAGADGGLRTDARGDLGLELGLAWLPRLGDATRLALGLAARVEPLADRRDDALSASLTIGLRLGGRPR